MGKDGGDSYDQVHTPHNSGISAEQCVEFAQFCIFENDDESNYFRAKLSCVSGLTKEGTERPCRPSSGLFVPRYQTGRRCELSSNVPSMTCNMLPLFAICMGAELVYEEAVSGHPRMPPLKPDVSVVEYLEGLAARGPGGSSSPTRTGTMRRLNATSVRLCNNQLVTMQGLDKVLHHVLDDTSELVWLDASCNQLISIDDVITLFPKLQARGRRLIGSGSSLLGYPVMGLTEVYTHMCTGVVLAWQPDLTHE